MTSDILDVLNISEKTRVEGNELKRKRSEQKENAANSAKRQRAGQMNRELFNLIGPNLPPVSVKRNTIKFKEKLKLNKEVKWEWQAFTPRSGVKNGPKFHHWVKTTVNKSQNTSTEADRSTSGQDNSTLNKSTTEKKEESAESDNLKNKYRFEKYNTKLAISDFTKAYYDENLKGLDEDWDYSETRYLFDVAKLYDLRWAVIADNYEYIPIKKTAISETNVPSDAVNENKVSSNVTEEDSKIKTKEESDTKEDDEAEKEAETNAGTKAEKKTEKKVEKKENTDDDTSTHADEKQNDRTKVSDGEKTENEKKHVKEDTDSSLSSQKEEEGQLLKAESKGKTDTEDSDDGTKPQEKISEKRKDSSQEVKQHDNTISDKMQDNANSDGDKVQGRTIEDLKDRLYKVSAVILEKSGDEIKDAALIRSLKSFNKNKEYERRSYLEHLIERTPTEIAEEESLVVEARKFELAAKKMLIERAQLLQLLDFPQASSSVQKYMTSQGLTDLYNVLMNADKSKKRKTETPVPPELGPSALPHTQLMQVKQQEAQQRVNRKTSRRKKKSTSPESHSGSSLPYDNEGMEIHNLLRSRLTQEQMDVYGISLHEEKLQPGVVLRSQKLPSFKPMVQNKVFEMLNEVGIAARPTMPTARVCHKFEELMKSMASLIDLKKQTDNLRTEISLIKSQRNAD